MKKLILILTSFIIINTANAGSLSKKDTDKAWDCVGIYMANYFLPSGETFEYSMKEKSMASVKVWKTYALEIGIKRKIGMKELIKQLINITVLNTTKN